MTDMLELRRVSVYYGNRAALDCVSLSVPHGAQVAVVGPNGAGKSTLFKAMVGLAPVGSGEILLHGRPAGEFRDPRRPPLHFDSLQDHEGTRHPRRVH